jgi:hypothetical protein
MTIHYSAILRPYADEMLSREQQEIENRVMFGAKHDEPSEDALDYVDDACLDCGKTFDRCSCAPDTHRETIDFAYCAR